MDARKTMTRNVLVAPAQLPLEIAYDLMMRSNIRHLPVTASGALVGMLSDRDLLLAAVVDENGRLQFPDRPVATLMTPSPLTCEASTSVSDLAKRMIEEKIDALPVMSGSKLVGLVTSTDLLQLLVDREEHRVLPFRFELRDIEVGAVA